MCTHILIETERPAAAGSEGEAGGHRALAPDGWALVLHPCIRLGAALLARPGALRVQRLPAEDKQRLRLSALVLACALRCAACERRWPLVAGSPFVVIHSSPMSLLRRLTDCIVAAGRLCALLLEIILIEWRRCPLGWWSYRIRWPQRAAAPNSQGLRTLAPATPTRLPAIDENSDENHGWAAARTVFPRRCARSRGRTFGNAATPPCQPLRLPPPSSSLRAPCAPSLL